MRKQVDKTGVVMSPLWCGAGNTHGVDLIGQSFGPVLSAAQTLTTNIPTIECGRWSPLSFIARQVKWRNAYKVITTTDNCKTVLGAIEK